MSIRIARVTDEVVDLVESTVVEVAATLYVGGVRITGMVCPLAFYYRWIARTIGMSTAGANRFLPSEDDFASELDEDFRDSAIAAWNERHPGGDPERSDEAFERFAIRDAMVQTGLRNNWQRHQYLLVASSAVDAFSFGITEIE